MKKSFVGLVLVIAIMLVFSTNIFAAGCGNWTIYEAGPGYCHDNYCHGWEAWHGSYGQTIKEHRQCVRADNSTYWEENTYTEWNGCCAYT
jgi:hypothetical protein